METELLKIFTNIPLAGAIALVSYFLIKDVLAPLVRYFVNKRNGVSTDMEKRINQVQHNDLHEINRRLDVLDANDIRMEERMNKLSEDISWLKAKVNRTDD